MLAYSTPERLWRFKLVPLVLTVAAAAIALRLVQIQILDSKSYQKLARNQYTKKYVVRAPRGLIYDRNHTPLALNQPCFDIGVDRRFVKDIPATSRRLGSILKTNPLEIQNKIRKASKYVQLGRQLDEKTASQIMFMDLPGVQLTRLSERVYPLNEKLAPVLGFVNIEGRGASGIELACDAYLAGKNGATELQRDAKGNSLMAVSDTNTEEKSGSDIILTIDHVVQIIAEQELARAMSNFNAKGGSVTIINPNSGEILAMASAPGFDANHASYYPADNWRIRPVTDIFEPGSTYKIVTMAAALSEGIKKPDDIIYCENGKYRIFGEEISDTKKLGWLTFDNVFVYSSNIGAAKIAQEIGRNKMFIASRNFGFGNRTGIELPGEVSGILKKPIEWSKFSLAAISYGHEVGVTPLQIALAYAAVANGGTLMKPAIIKEIRSKENKTLYRFKPQHVRRVMTPEIAKTLTAILEQAVEKGTGELAQLPDLKIAGKTGTAQKLADSHRGYSDTHYMASFAGFYPSEQAKIVILVTLDEPNPVHSGGHAAAPVFRAILQRILDFYNKDLGQI
jgi:cell division protein FtsI (penicillin-binding protein 3)